VSGDLADIAQTARLRALQALADANPELLELDIDACVVWRKVASRRGKVAIVSGGGSGHEPLHTGFVGPGMLDAACAGHYFTSPTPDQIVCAAHKAEAGAGVLFVVKNYQGDVLNFSLAASLCTFRTELVFVSDDMATREDSLVAGRGLAGTMVVEKVLGAAADAGLDLVGLKMLGDEVNASTRTFGLALSSCRIPGAARPIYELGRGEMEIGVGIHGERGRARVAAGDIEALASALVGRVLPTDSSRNARPLMILNGLGGAHDRELKELNTACLRLLKHVGIQPSRKLTGSFATALDTHGFSLTLSDLTADTLRYWDAPVRTPALKWDTALQR
jgi:phosphoenolpyruvate---glycerone phosphotransferase subunit DhaK